MSKTNFNTPAFDEALRQIEHRRVIRVFAPLTAWRVTYDDGSVQVQDAAADITLEEARKYWVGQRFVRSDEKTFRTGVTVEQVIGPSNEKVDYIELNTSKGKING